MGIFKFFSSKENKEQSAASKALSQEYDKTLIKRFTEEHAVMLSQINKIKEYVDSSLFSQAREELRLFNDLYVKHLSQEQYMINSFLEKNLSDRPVFLSQMKQFRKQLTFVNTEVILLRHEWTVDNITKNSTGFLKALKLTEEQLLIRIAQEESEIFPVYEHYLTIKSDPKYFSDDSSEQDINCDLAV